jgi:hypothetical protein
MSANETQSICPSHQICLVKKTMSLMAMIQQEKEFFVRSWRKNRLYHKYYFVVSKSIFYFTILILFVEEKKTDCDISRS